MARLSEEKERLSKQLSIRVTEDEYARVERLAVHEERNMADVGRRIVRRGLPLEEQTAGLPPTPLSDDDAS